MYCVPLEYAVPLARLTEIFGRSRRIQQSKSELYPSGGAFCPSQRRIRRSIHRKVKKADWELAPQ